MQREKHYAPNLRPTPSQRYNSTHILENLPVTSNISLSLHPQGCSEDVYDVDFEGDTLCVY